MYYCNEPELIFYGGTRTAVAGALIGVDALSIGLHVLFIMAIYKMAGWESDFAFVLLITMSAIAIFRYMDDIVCYVLALKYVDFCTNHHLFTTLGSIKLSAYFSTILIALLMSIHRMIYTLRATRASSLLTPRFMKGVLVLVCGFFAAVIVVANPDDVHYHFVPSYLSYDDLSESTWEILRLTQKTINYTFALSSVITYAVIFTYLFICHSLSFKNNNELRMTVQMVLSVIIQCLYSVYWEFIEVEAMTVGGQITRSVISLTFHDIILLPYLVINKRIQNRIVEMICCKNSSKFRIRKVFSSRLASDNCAVNP